MNKNFKKGILCVISGLYVFSLPFSAFCSGKLEKISEGKKPSKTATSLASKSAILKNKIELLSNISLLMPLISDANFGALRSKKIIEFKDGNEEKISILKVYSEDQILKLADLNSLLNCHDVIIFEPGSVGTTRFLGIIKMVEEAEEGVWKKQICPLDSNAENKTSENVFEKGYRFVLTNTKTCKIIVFNMEIGNCFSEKVGYSYYFRSEFSSYNKMLRMVLFLNSVSVTGVLPECIGKKAIRSFTVSDKVKKIKEECFSNASNLVSIKFSGEIESLGKSAFSKCINLMNVDFSKGVKCIENNAFEGCRSLENIVFPEGLEYLGSKVFNGCKNLKSITLPYSLEKVSPTAFEGSPDSLKIIYKNKSLDKSNFFININA